MRILLSGVCFASLTALAGDLSFTISADRTDAQYRLGEEAVFTVTAKDADGAPAKSGIVCWKLNNFGDKVFASGEEDLSTNGGTFTVKGAQTEPGFLRLDVAEKVPDPVYTMWGVVFDPEKIVPGTPNPPDFMDFWREAIRNYDREVTEPIRETEVERTDEAVMYELRIPSTQGRYVWGYFSEPLDKSKGPYPLTVTVPGAGPSTWGGRGMKADAMSLWVNVHYYDPVVLKGEKHKSPKCLAVQKVEDEAYAKKYPVKNVRYTNCGIAVSREDYFYYGVILAANRAVDWAASRPGVDAKRIGYSGISQGGGFGLILTSLNKNIRFARIAVPALTDLLGDRISSREAGWPRLVDAQLPENRSAAEENAPYFCGVNFARHIDVPIGFVVGFIDTVCPPHAGYAAYNVCPSKTKAMFHSIGRGHDANSGEGGKALSEWMSNIPCGAAEDNALKSPETSRLFVRHVDLSSGVESWVLKPGIFSFHQQGCYFTQRSMTDDGRFLFFLACDPEFEADGRTEKKDRLVTTALIDFKTDTITDLRISRQVPFLDVKTDQMWYFRTRETGETTERHVCRRDLLVDPSKEIVVCKVPDELLKGVKTVHRLSTHPTLTTDRKKMFIAAHLDDRYEQGCINLETGAWESWGETPFYANHDQINPVRDDIALVAWEGCARNPDAVEYMNKTGWYPRMWLAYPDGRREMQPSRIPGHNYATHEHWAEDGKGFYWCAEAVHYQNLATGEQETISPWLAFHATMSSDNRFVTFDAPVDEWYRGCQWQVGFWNRDAKRGLYIHAFRPRLCDNDGGWHDHPDPHPSFVCNDRYILCTINGEDHRMNLSLTPVAPLVARTAIDPASFFANLPEEARPRTIAVRLAEHFLECPADDYRPRGYKYRNYGGELVEYPLVSLWVNSLANARLAGDACLEKRLIEHFEPFLGEKKAKQSPMNHVDYSVFGALPLQIAILNGDERCLKLGLKYADRQWSPPDDATVNAKHALPRERQEELWKAGYTPQTRLWIDDMYMITLLQLQAYRATGETNYLVRTMREMRLYIDELQLKDGPASGLFYHAPDVPFVWGRGAGWMAAGMALLLSEASPQNGDWHVIMEGYRRMMAALLKHQRANGLWGQLVNDPESWDETSGSAMYAYAFVEGVRHGWLEPDVYGPAARKAWLALVDKLDEYANLKDVCIGTGKRNDRAWYMGRPREAGDPHGQAAMSWICRTLMEMGM